MQKAVTEGYPSLQEGSHTERTPALTQHPHSGRPTGTDLASAETPASTMDRR